jgi:transcriptional regulator with XRE-family HTH domain
VSTHWWQPQERYVSPCDVTRVVGDRLHALRLEAELSVQEVGALAGMHPVRVRYYEGGGTITLPVLARLAHALDLDVIDLVWDLRHPPPAPRWRQRTRDVTTNRTSARRRETARIGA